MIHDRRMDRAADSVFHRLSARVFYAAFQHLSGTALPPGAGDFRLLDRKAVEESQHFQCWQCWHFWQCWQ